MKLLIMRAAPILTGLFSLLATAEAFAYSMSHEYYSRNRPLYGSNVYMSQQVQYVRTTADVVAAVAAGVAPRTAPGLNLSDAAKLNGDGENLVKESLTGHSLNAAVGMEHFRFLQTGIFYSNVQQTGAKNRGFELRGHEAGGEAKIVLHSPVVNVVLGGGVFATNTVVQNGSPRTTLTGTGYRGGVDFAYFASSNINLVFSVTAVQVVLTDKSGNADVKSINVNSTRAGGGIIVWL